MELFKANNQWSTRPADERFGSLQEMYDACKHYADTARVARTPYSELRVEAENNEVQITGKTGQFARLTHWSFGQLAQLIGAPAGYLRDLPATLAVQNLNYGLKHRLDDKGDGTAQMLFHQNGSLLLRAVTSEVYQRIWNWEIAKRLISLQEAGWRVPPARPAKEGQAGARPATQEDILDVQMTGLGVKVGDIIAPAGLYASDHDMFAFLINETNRINDGTDQGLGRGFFVENSEVGDSAFKLATFLYRFVCGNHIVWGAKNVREISVRHVGRANSEAWARMAIMVRNYAESSASDVEAQIARARRFEIAAKKEDVLDKLFGLKIGTRKILEASYAKAEENVDIDGSPRTAWGFAQGMTRVSQESEYADKRVDMDKAAGKVIEIAF